MSYCFALLLAPLSLMYTAPAACRARRRPRRAIVALRKRDPISRGAM